jgi:dynein heavy chain
MVEKVLSI